MTFSTIVEVLQWIYAPQDKYHTKHIFKKPLIASISVQLNVPAIHWSQKFWCQEGGVTCQMNTLLNSRAEI